jgi:phosphatidylglycerophosphate synthase
LVPVLVGEVVLATSADTWRDAVAGLPPWAPVTVIGAGTVVSPQFFATAASVAPGPDEVREVAAGSEWPRTGVLRMRAGHAVNLSTVIGELARRRNEAAPLPTGEDVAKGLAALVLRVAGEEDLPSAEATIRRATFKPTDAKVARFNRRISLPISIALMPTPLTANQMSLIIVCLGLAAGWLFSRGEYLTGVVAGFLSLAASVLDGCDGELARLKYQESALGCWIETIGDYSYYLAIFAGLTVGAVRQPAYFWFGATGLTGTVVSFALLIFLRSRITAGQPETLHVIAKARFKSDPSWWSKVVWRVSFVATRAAMPYGIMALALVNLLPLVVVLSAVGANVYWISLVLKLRHLLGTEPGEAVAA